MFETNFVSKGGAFYLGHIPLPSLIKVNERAFVIVIVFVGRQKTIPSPVSILDSISVLKDSTEISIIEISIDEDNPFIYEIDLKLFSFLLNEASREALKGDRRHLATCTESRYDWVDKSEENEYEPPIVKNGVTMYSDAHAEHSEAPIETLDDLSGRVDEYEQKCLRFAKKNDPNKDLEDVIRSNMYDYGSDRLLPDAKITFINFIRRAITAEMVTEEPEDESSDSSQPFEYEFSDNDDPGSDGDGQPGPPPAPAPQPPAQQAAAPVPQPRVIMTRSRNKAEKEQGPAYNTRNRSKLKSNIN